MEFKISMEFKIPIQFMLSKQLKMEQFMLSKPKQLKTELLYFEEEIKKSEIKDFKDLGERLENLKQSLLNEKITILLFGETSAGKTSFANLLCAYRESFPDYPFDEQFFNALPEDEDENTYYTWIIESSKDQQFRIEKIEDGTVRETFKTSVFEDYCKKIHEYNKEQMKFVTTSVGEENEKKTIIKIFLPGMLNFIRIIDLPGTTADWALQRLQEMVSSEMTFLFYFKNMKEPKIVQQDIQKFYKFLNENKKKF